MLIRHIATILAGSAALALAAPTFAAAPADNLPTCSATVRDNCVQRAGHGGKTMHHKMRHRKTHHKMRRHHKKMRHHATHRASTKTTAGTTTTHTVTPASGKSAKTTTSMRPSGSAKKY